MSNTLIKEGLRALSEQIKRDETGRPTKGSVAKTAREIRKAIERSKYKGPEDFNSEILYALNPDEYNPYNENPSDTISSDQPYQPFKGMNKDPDYFFKNPPEAQGFFPNLETGVERRQRRYPGTATMAPINPIVRGSDYSADDFNIIKNHAKQRTYYDI